MSQNIGRPALSDKQVDTLFRKLEPYLKAGLSINKACLKAQIPKSTIYDLQSENSEFAERIEVAQNHLSIVVAEIVSNELELIKTKQAGGSGLTRDQIKFIQWVATNSRATKEEFSRDEIKEAENQAIESVKNDPKTINNLLGAYQRILDNMGYTLTPPS
ncbi:MAG: hypothetical protein AUK08_03575 [Candidatus Pacebacteria bacterium CG2_30_36_39]|nr:MAG: hypothetical protein AUK08_03575 [Candidatus Pacebacteria bacterium CG2_30_36_39]